MVWEAPVERRGFVSASLRDISLRQGHYFPGNSLIKESSDDDFLDAGTNMIGVIPKILKRFPGTEVRIWVDVE